MPNNEMHAAQVFVGALMMAGETVPDEVLLQAGIIGQPQPISAVRDMLVRELQKLQFLIKLVDTISINTTVDAELWKSITTTATELPSETETGK